MLDVADEDRLLGAEQLFYRGAALLGADRPEDAGARLAQERSRVPGDTFAVCQSEDKNRLAGELQKIHAGNYSGRSLHCARKREPTQLAV